MTVCTMRQVYGAEPGLIEPLAALLIDAVHSGAAVGFLALLPVDAACQYWAGVMAATAPSCKNCWC